MAADKYMAFVQAGKGLPSPFENLKNQVFLGDDEFVQDMLCKLDLEQSLEDVPKLQRRAPAKSFASYERQFDDRNTAICQAYASGGYSLKEVGEYFGLHYSRVSRIISGAKDKTCPRLVDIIRFIIRVCVYRSSYPGLMKPMVFFSPSGCKSKEIQVIT